MRALIADDEPLLRAELREALALAWPELRIVAEAADGRRALAAVLEHRPEVAFLDVNMPHLDGMAAARQMRERGYAGEIVFVTAYDQHALQAFEARAIDYLVKPLEPARLGDTVTRLKARLAGLPQAAALPAAEAASPWLRVTRGTQTQLLRLEDVACLRAVPGYTQLVTRDGEHLVELPLKALQPRLDPLAFVQVHRAAIVNLHFVARIVRDRPGHCVVELKHGLGQVEASRAGAELLRSL
ncbi:LytR/AlgR family response regulator transcription factor [Methylibium rhizosphaerae]|jgi:DNA-binding LytR/AlgR family response regulator|uniref:LytR/AlgR family response regulator transcription factor n=1 Tax=Methylibium rhizosphaerae TaxID=2570323 RepID=UPI0015E3955C|nr:LytTR family DNA-binding domain-containing protein [Methylibium rhizosphaerae]